MRNANAVRGHFKVIVPRQLPRSAVRSECNLDICNSFVWCPKGFSFVLPRFTRLAKAVGSLRRGFATDILRHYLKPLDGNERMSRLKVFGKMIGQGRNMA
jgi:hypothetical protein